MEEITICLVNISIIKQHLSYVNSFVSKQRKKKAEKFVHENDQLLSLAAGYLLKKFLPSEDIKITDSGKPYLPDGPFFNVSHSSQYAVLAISSSRDVGVDIEYINEDNVKAIQYVLSDEEKVITDVKTLFQMWSNKESLIKCLSTGLKDIKSVGGLPLEGARTFKGEQYYSKSMIYDGYSLAVSLKGKEPFKINIKLIESIE